MRGVPGHAFISYVREDRKRVDRLQGILEAAGIKVWRDTANLWPGQDWKIEIRRAITTDSLAFIACFSENSQAREKSYQNEELILAVEQMRLRAPGQAWLIPVRFAECDIPAFDLGAGRTLDSLQRVDLLDASWEHGGARLVAAVLRILQIPAARSEGGAAPRGGLRQLFDHSRVRGDISCGDIRNWILFFLLSVLAAITAFLAMRGWPKTYNYNGSEKPDPHRYICYAVITVASVICLVSILEAAVVSSRKVADSMPLPVLREEMNRPLARVLRSARAAFALTGIAFVFSGLFGFVNTSPAWCISVAAMGGLSLISLVSVVVQSLLGSVLLLLAATFVPVNLGGGQPILGLTTMPGIFAAISAIIIGIGWFYYIPSPILILFILPTLPMVVLGAYDSNEPLGPYVALVACVALGLSLAVGSNRPWATE